VIPAGILKGGLDQISAAHIQIGTSSLPMSAETAAIVERAVGYKVSDLNQVAPPISQTLNQAQVAQPQPLQSQFQPPQHQPQQSSIAATVDEDSDVGPAIGGSAVESKAQDNIAVTTLFNPRDTTTPAAAISNPLPLNGGLPLNTECKPHPTHPMIGSRRDIDSISRLDRFSQEKNCVFYSFAHTYIYTYIILTIFITFYFFLSCSNVSSLLNPQNASNAHLW